MDFNKMYISELVNLRKKARNNNNWDLSDKIREYLDTKNTFIFDTKDGQVIYYELDGMTRDKLIDKINKEKQANKLFDSWLFSIKQSIIKTK